MITIDKVKELLDQQDGVEGVEVCRNEFIKGQFLNRINADEPHGIVVHPVEEKQVLKVVVPHVAKVKSGGDLYRVLSHLTYDMLLGKVGVDQDGEVRFDISHACRDGADIDPPPEVFARLVEVAMDMTNHIVLLATHVGMVEAGVPEDVARKFIEQFREQEKEDGDDEETL